MANEPQRIGPLLSTLHGRLVRYKVVSTAYQRVYGVQTEVPDTHTHTHTYSSYYGLVYSRTGGGFIDLPR